MASLSVLGVAAYATSTAYTAFSSVGGSPAGRTERNLRLSQQMPMGSEQGRTAGTSIAGACALGVAAAALGAARAGKRSARRADVLPRAAGEGPVLERLAGTGPKSIQVGKAAASSFATLIAACEKAGLTAALAGPGPFTVFAPDDASFGEFLTTANLTADQLLANPDLGKILQHHVVSGTVLQKDFKNTTLTSIAGTSIVMKKGVKGVSVSGVIIKKPDVTCDNATIHIISSVMMP